MPTLDVILIAGNHDSAGRLEAPSPILRELGVHVVGLLGRGPDGALDGDWLLLPIRNRDGDVKAICAAIPILRPTDLLSPPGVADVGDPLIWGVEQVYGEAIDLARRRLGREQALIVTGHCYMTGCELSELSERKILGGHQHALPGSLFPADVAYGALGHLHKPQSVGDRRHVRYAGSPLPLAVNEKDYPHQVVLACFEAGRFVHTEAISVPRSVEYWRVPSAGARVPSEIVEKLRRLPANTDPSAERRPFLEVVVLLERPAPSLRHDIEQALDGKFVRLVRLQTVYPEERGAVSGAKPALPELAELQPEQVFRMCYHDTYKGEPDAQMLADFHELMDAAHRTDG